MASAKRLSFMSQVKAQTAEVMNMETLADGTVIEVLDDGSRKQTKPNGQVIHVRNDNSILQIEPDGTQMESSADGVTTQTNVDGTMIQSFPDGKSVQTSPDGTSITCNPDGTWTQVSADGTIIQANVDGSTMQTDPDGSCLKTLPNGTKIKCDQQGRELFKIKSTKQDMEDAVIAAEGPRRGSFVPEQTAKANEIVELPDGTTIQHREDGVRVQRNPDGLIIEQYPDGKIVQLNPPHPGGIKITVEQDGKMTQEDPDGFIVETFTDGTEKQTFPDKTILMTLPDGSSKQTNPDGVEITTRPDGSTLQTMTNGVSVEIRPDGTRRQIGHAVPAPAPSNQPLPQPSATGPARKVDWDSVIADLQTKTPAQLRKIAKDMNLKVTTWNAKHLRELIQDTLQQVFCDNQDPQPSAPVSAPAPAPQPEVPETPIEVDCEPPPVGHSHKRTESFLDLTRNASRPRMKVQPERGLRDFTVWEDEQIAAGHSRTTSAALEKKNIDRTTDKPDIGGTSRQWGSNSRVPSSRRRKSAEKATLGNAEPEPETQSGTLVDTEQRAGQQSVAQENAQKKAQETVTRVPSMFSSTGRADPPQEISATAAPTQPPSHPVQPVSNEELSSMTVTQLRKECAKRELKPNSWMASKLVALIISAQNSGGPVAAPPPQQTQKVQKAPPVAFAPTPAPADPAPAPIDTSAPEPSVKQVSYGTDTSARTDLDEVLQADNLVDSFIDDGEVLDTVGELPVPTNTDASSRAPSNTSSRSSASGGRNNDASMSIRTDISTAYTDWSEVSSVYEFDEVIDAGSDLDGKSAEELRSILSGMGLATKSWDPRKLKAQICFARQAIRASQQPRPR